MGLPIVGAPEDLNAAWASRLLGRPVDDVTVAPVGTGQIGTVYRVGVGAPEGSVLAKLPAADPAVRDLLAGAYRGEIRFYAEIADTVSIRVPRVFQADIEPTGGAFTLVMEDLAPAAQGDQIAGCTDAQAEEAVRNLAGLHGPRWCDPNLLEIEGLSLNGPEDAALMGEMFGPTVDTFLDQVGERLAPGTADVVRRTAEVIEGWALARQERFGLVHGDFRLDNLIFGVEEGGAVAVHTVDWQTLSLALPARDLAYFTATSLHPDQRARIEAGLVQTYHRGLLTHSVADYPLDLCWEDYRFAMLQAPLVCVFGCAYGTRSERGDAMFAVMVDRAARAIEDLGTFDLVG